MYAVTAAQKSTAAAAVRDPHRQTRRDNRPLEPRELVATPTARARNGYADKERCRLLRTRGSGRNQSHPASSAPAADRTQHIPLRVLSDATMARAHRRARTNRLSRHATTPVETQCDEPAANLSVFDGSELPHDSCRQRRGGRATVHVICRWRTVRLHEHPPSGRRRAPRQPACRGQLPGMRSRRWRVAWRVERPRYARAPAARAYRAVVPSATPGAVLGGSSASRRQQQQRAAEAAAKAVLSEEDSDCDEEDAKRRTTVDLWPRAPQLDHSVASPPPPEPPVATWTPATRLPAANGRQPPGWASSAATTVYACGALGVVQSAAASQLQRHFVRPPWHCQSALCPSNGRLVATAAQRWSRLLTWAGNRAAAIQ